MSSAISSGSTTVTQSTNVTQSAETTTPRVNLVNDEGEDTSVNDSISSSTTLTERDRPEGQDTTFELKLTNLALLKEIAQLKTDKEFVWSLWKRLQVANPNIAAAMDVVVSREREKAEAKDEKVLKILSIKDKRIRDLEERSDAVDRGSAEMAEKLEEARTEGEKALGQRDDEIVSLKKAIEKLTREKDEREKAIASIQEEVSGKVEKARAEVEVLARREITLTRDAESLERAAREAKKLSETLEKENRDLRNGLKEIEEKETKVKASYSEAKTMLRAFDEQRQKDEKLVEAKNRELESARQELVTMWEKHKVEAEKTSSLQNIVTQLQKLQTNTQNVIKNQEVVFETDANNLKVSFESLKAEMKERLDSAAAECGRLKRENAELNEKVEELGRASKDKEIQAGLTTRRDQISHVSEAVLECEFEMMQLKREQSALKDKLQEKNKLILELESWHSTEDKENVVPSVPQPPSRAKITKKAPVAPANADKLASKLQRSEELVRAKQDLIDAMEKAHSSRAKRVEELQKEIGKSAADVLANNRHVDVAQLTGKVKEIVFLRNENLKVTKENIDLREQLDTLKVDLASKNVKVQSHTTELDTLRDKLNAKILGLERRATDYENLKRAEEEVNVKLKMAESDLRISRNGVKSLEAEKGKLVAELRRSEKCLSDLQHAHLVSSDEVAQLRLEASEGQKDVHRAKTLFDKERTRTAELNEQVSSLRLKVEEINAEWKRKIAETDAKWKRKFDEIERVRSEEKNQKDSVPSESSATEDVTTESDADTLKHLKDSFQSTVARAIAKNGREKSDRSSKKQQLIIRNRVLHLRRLNAAHKAEKEALRLKCNELQSAITEMRERLSARETEVAAEKELKEHELSGVVAELQQLQQREKEKKKLHQEVVQNSDSLKSELSRLKTLVKAGETARLKIVADLEASQDKLKAVDKDILRKKSLIEDFKLKVKSATAEKDDAIKASLQLEEKLKTTEETVKSLKKATETLKHKMNKLTEDVAAKEAELKTCHEERRVKEKDLKTISKKLKESDGSLSELEQVARREMENLVETSESQLLALQNQVLTSQKFIELLKDQLLQFASCACDMHETIATDSIRKLRRSGRSPAKNDGGMLGAAKNTAKEILQLSDDDIDDIMSCLSLSGENGERDNRAGSLEVAEIRVNCANWVAAVRKAIDSEDKSSTNSLFYLLKSKLQEIVMCENDCRERLRAKENFMSIAADQRPQSM